MPIDVFQLPVRVLFVFAISLTAASAQESSQDLSKSISLTEVQRQALKALENDSAAKAAGALLKLPEIARAFNANLLSERPDPELDQKLSHQMEEIFAEVIRLRISRIHSAVKTLTPEQRRALAEELKKPDAPYIFDDLVKRVLGDERK